jgi:hypothetical protein
MLNITLHTQIYGKRQINQCHIKNKLIAIVPWQVKVEGRGGSTRKVEVEVIDNKSKRSTNKRSTGGHVATD